jgi:hypothetical protein
LKGDAMTVNWNACCKREKAAELSDSDRQFLRDAAIAAMQGMLSWYMDQGETTNIVNISKDAWKVADYLLAEEKRRLEQKC